MKFFTRSVRFLSACVTVHRPLESSCSYWLTAAFFTPLHSKSGAWRNCRLHPGLSEDIMFAPHTSRSVWVMCLWQTWLFISSPLRENTTSVVSLERIVFNGNCFVPQNKPFTVTSSCKVCGDVKYLMVCITSSPGCYFVIQPGCRSKHGLFLRGCLCCM